MSTVLLFGIPVSTVVLLVLGIVAVIASDKFAETLRQFLLLVVCYFLLVYLGTYSYVTSLDSSSDLTTMLLGKTVVDIPFLSELFQWNELGIIGFLCDDVSAFFREALCLVLLSLLAYMMLEVAKLICSLFEKQSNPILSLLIPLFIRYCACILACIGYAWLIEYVVKVIPEGIITFISYVTFLVMISVLVSPLISFLSTSAKIAHNQVLERFCEFASKNRVGTVLQSTFFAVYFSVLLMVMIQESGLMKRLIQLLLEGM